MPEQTQDELRRILSGPHVYEGGRYRTQHPANTEYPRVMFRKRTPEEVQQEQENMPKAMWLDAQVDLIQLTGHNYPKKVQYWEEYTTRPIEQIVYSLKEEKALGQNWTRILEDARA